MKSLIVAAAVSVAAVAAAQSSRVPRDGDLPGLTTPNVLARGRSELGLQLNAFGGFDKTSRIGVFYGLGIARDWEASFGGTFGKESSVTLADRDVIDYGGSDADLLLKYRLPIPIEASLQGGIGYSHTPPQLGRVEGLFGASIGWPIASRVRVYADPKVVALQGNSLVAISLGAVVDVTRGVRIFGDWTPLLSGENTISSIDGSRERVQLYAVGIRFPDVLPATSVDLAYTNIVGETTGFSLTPSLGNTGGLYVGLDFRF